MPKFYYVSEIKLKNVTEIIRSLFLTLINSIKFFIIIETISVLTVFLNSFILFSNKSYLPCRNFIIISALLELLRDGTTVGIIFFTKLIMSVIYSSHDL
jgi:hypothetical protein